MEKVSIIIPVYNGELYIRQCIESVMNQTYQNLEILIIDDGSGDDSLNICKELSLKDKRIHVFSKKKYGVSIARNYGLDIASGDYVFFLDSDDTIHPLLIEKLFHIMKQYNTDLSMCNCKKMNNCQMKNIIHQKAEDKSRYQWEMGDINESREWFHITHINELSAIGGKMIRRKTIETMRFERDLVYGEDTLFLYKLICKGIRIAYLRLEWYYYRQHQGSITHSDGMKINEKYFECIKRIRDSEYDQNHLRFALRWEERLVERIENSVSLMKKVKNKKEWRMFRKKVAEERRHPLFHMLNRNQKWLFWSCVFCQPFYKLTIQEAKIRMCLIETVKSWYYRSCDHA